MKGKRPKRKVVLVFVEGQSEINALKPTISALFDSINPDIEVFFPTIVEDGCDTRGDITSKHGISADVIEGCINKLVLKPFFAIEKLYPKDITEIIQLVDMDGAYIPNCQIIFGENPNGERKPYYDETGIITTDIESIVERNKRKRENLNYLSSISEIQVQNKHPQYSIYFFSSNLDHFIHGDANLSVRDKAKKAEEFATHYELDPIGFTAAIKATPGALLNMSYEESWNFIKEDDNSIKRYSNINILLDRLISQMESELQ